MVLDAVVMHFVVLWVFVAHKTFSVGDSDVSKISVAHILAMYVCTMQQMLVEAVHGVCEL